MLGVEHVLPYLHTVWVRYSPLNTYASMLLRLLSGTEMLYPLLGTLLFVKILEFKQQRRRSGYWSIKQMRLDALMSLPNDSEPRLRLYPRALSFRDVCLCQIWFNDREGLIDAYPGDRGFMLKWTLRSEYERGGTIERTLMAQGPLDNQ